MSMILREKKVVSIVNFFHGINILSNYRVPSINTSEMSFFQVLFYFCKVFQKLWLWKNLEKYHKKLEHNSLIINTYFDAHTCMSL